MVRADLLVLDFLFQLVFGHTRERRNSGSRK